MVGKNLFAISSFKMGSIIGTDTTIRVCSYQNIYLEAGTYTFSTNLSSTFRFNLTINSIGNAPLNAYPTYSYNSGWKTSTPTFTFTITESGYFTVLLSKADNSTLTLNDIKDFTYMLNKGSTVTEYEPYKSQTYSVDLGSIELCKIGDYQDYIYKENGNWYLYKAIGKEVLDGSENWAYYVSDANKVFYTPKSDATFGSSTSNPILSTHFKSEYATNNGNTFLSGSEHRLNFCTNIIGDSDVIPNWTNWLSNNNTTIYYALTTPTTTQITDETLLSQLEALAGATTYLDQTNIITSGSTLNPLLDVTTYAVDDTNFNITNNGNIYSKPIITIYGVGTIGLYLNGIQVLSLDMGETTSQITIDVAKLEAYNQETGALMNRSVTGDYNNLSLNVGENTITESGTLQGIEIENYSRWL